MARNASSRSNAPLRFDDPTDSEDDATAKRREKLKKKARKRQKRTKENESGEVSAETVSSGSSIEKSSSDEEVLIVNEPVADNAAGAPKPLKNRVDSSGSVNQVIRAK